MTNHAYCTYSFFLFSKLHDLIVHSESEYDILYEEQCSEYNKFRESSYNNPDEPEYECIVEYLYSITPQ